MTKYKYSFESERIDSCEKCICCNVSPDSGEMMCNIDNNIECSDISIPEECQLVESEVE